MNTNEFTLYLVIFLVDGSIIVEHHLIEMKTKLCNHNYSDLTTFLCCCAINDGEIPDSDELYNEVYKTFKTSCLTEDKQFNDVAINMSNADTVGRRIALRSFYSLPEEYIKYLQHEYNYFLEASFSFEKRMEEISEEIHEFQDILQNPSISILKEKIKKHYKTCLMYEDISMYDLSEDEISKRIYDIDYEIKELEFLECKYQDEMNNEPALNIYYNKLAGKLFASIDKMNYLQTERLKLKYNHRNSSKYISDEYLEIRLKDIEDEMKEHEQDLEFNELDMESTDGFNTDYYRFESIAITCKTLLDELDEEHKFLEKRLQQLHQKQKN